MPVALVRTLIILALVGPAACVVIDDPKHCWNRERDATCQRIHDNPAVVCSSCLRGWNGCANPGDVPPECRDPAADDGGSSDAESSTGEPADDPDEDRESSATNRGARR